jgi:uncharacterized membrane-anchored protein
MSVATAKSAYENLTPSEKQNFHDQTNTRQLADPSSQTNDVVWLIVISTLAFVLIGTIGALALFAYDAKSTEVIGPIVTFILGIFGGLLAPTPVKSSNGSS